MERWSNKLGHRSRKSWALLVGPGDDVREFAGASIPGVVAVIGYDCTSEGKWSATIYRFELAPGVRFIAGHNGWETGRFTEGLAAATGLSADRWADVANALGVSVPTAMAFLRETRPKAAAELDGVEAALAALDEAEPVGAEELTISFGSPTKRERAAGFWAWPVVVTVNNKEVGRVTPTDNGAWTASGSVKVLKEVRAAGTGGGYVTLRLAVPAGAKAEHRA